MPAAEWLPSGMLRSQHSLDVLHHKHRGRKFFDDPQVLPVQEMPFVCLKFRGIAATHPSATSDRVSLTRRPADQEPLFRSGQTIPNPGVNLAVIAHAQFRAFGF